MPPDAGWSARPRHAAARQECPIELATSLAQQLQDLDDSQDLGQALHRLGGDLTTAVPSLLTVSLIVVHRGVPVPITIATGRHTGAAVLASLAVDLAGTAGSRTQLILRAGNRGAFLLLRDELAALPAPRRPAVQVDQHLSPAAPPGPALASARADLAAIDRAIGVLLDRGLPPEAARADLRRRAELAGTSVAAAGHAILAELRAPD